MKRPLVALLSPLALLSCAQPAPLAVRDVWTRDTVGRTASAAIFMTISSGQPDRLIGASTPLATKTDLMTFERRGGVTGMKYVQAVDIPPGTPVTLDPAGLHVWLADLKSPLRAGETFPLTLRFQQAGERRLAVRVIGASEPPPRSRS